MQSRQLDPIDIQPKLLSWLQKTMPQAEDLFLSSLDLPGGGLGFSNVTFFFDLSWKELARQKSQKMVLRCPPQSEPLFPEYDLGTQYRIMELLMKTKVPVPRVLGFEEDKDIIGAPFYLMEKIEGQIIPDMPSYHTAGFYFDATPKQRARMWFEGLEVLARIHQLEWKGLGFSFLGEPDSGTDAIDRQLSHWEDCLTWIRRDSRESHPILDAALAWLKDNPYEPERVTLCWGDARLGNIIYNANHEAVAALDWEMAFLGDPEADLAWYLFLDWEFGAGAGLDPLEGHPDKLETIRRYEALTGWKVTNFFYNEVLSAFKHGIILAAIFKRPEIAELVGPDAIFNNSCTQTLARLLDLPGSTPALDESA